MHTRPRAHHRLTPSREALGRTIEFSAIRKKTPKRKTGKWLKEYLAGWALSHTHTLIQWHRNASHRNRCPVHKGDGAEAERLDPGACHVRSGHQSGAETHQPSAPLYSSARSFRSTRWPRSPLLPAASTRITISSATSPRTSAITDVRIRGRLMSLRVLQTAMCSTAVHLPTTSSPPLASRSPSCKRCVDWVLYCATLNFFSRNPSSRILLAFECRAHLSLQADLHQMFQSKPQYFPVTPIGASGVGAPGVGNPCM